MSTEQEQNLGSQLPDEEDTFARNVVSRRVKTRLEPFFYNDKGERTASKGLIESMKYALGIALLPGHRTLSPQQIAGGLREQATVRTSECNTELAKQLRAMAVSAVRK